MSWEIILWTTFILEFITILGRFVLKLKSRDFFEGYMNKKSLKKIPHFHHLFIGLIILLIALILDNSLYINLGAGVILSDLVHHFVILWFFIGNPEFHLVYKKSR